VCTEEISRCLSYSQNAALLRIIGFWYYDTLSHSFSPSLSSGLDTYYYGLYFRTRLDNLILNLQPGQNVEWYGILVILQVLADWLSTILVAVFGILIVVLRSQRYVSCAPRYVFRNLICFSIGWF